MVFAWAVFTLGIATTDSLCIPQRISIILMGILVNLILTVALVAFVPKVKVFMAYA